MNNIEKNIMRYAEKEVYFQKSKLILPDHSVKFNLNYSIFGGTTMAKKKAKKKAPARKKVVKAAAKKSVKKKAAKKKPAKKKATKKKATKKKATKKKK